MFADIDHKHPQVRYDLFYWVQWLRGQMKIGGLRLDAIKHYSAGFLRDLLAHIDERVDENWFLVGEYWREDSEFLAKFIEYMGHRMSLFDVQLVANLSRISLLGEKGDLREVFDDALVLWKPDHSVVSIPSLPFPIRYRCKLTTRPLSSTTTPKKGNPSRCVPPSQPPSHR